MNAARLASFLTGTVAPNINGKYVKPSHPAGARAAESLMSCPWSRVLSAQLMLAPAAYSEAMTTKREPVAAPNTNPEPALACSDRPMTWAAVPTLTQICPGCTTPEPVTAAGTSPAPTITGTPGGKPVSLAASALILPDTSTERNTGGASERGAPDACHRVSLQSRRWRS